jgi:hypothetical protein
MSDLHERAMQIVRDLANARWGAVHGHKGGEECDLCGTGMSGTVIRGDHMLPVHHAIQCPYRRAVEWAQDEKTGRGK